MSRPLWFVELLRRVYPARFLMARVTNLPVLGQIAERIFFDHDDLIYLPQDRVIPVQQAIDLPGEMALPSQVVETFIEQAHVHWIMDACICRQAEACQDYPTELGCLFLGEAAKGINPQLGRLVSKAEALQHVQRCREAGLVHLIGRNKLDTMWLGVGPGDRLLTICNCCPCCCLWRTLPHLNSRISAKITAMPGISVSVNGRCIGCGECTQGICFVEAIKVVEGRAVISDDCRACGRCAAVCPQQAIDVSFQYDDFVGQAIARISPLVNVS